MKFKIVEDISEIKITTESTDAYDGQVNMIKKALVNGNIVGYLTYSIYEDKPHIQMIEVSSDYRRQGIATKLLKSLQKDFPGVSIDTGWRTPDGVELFNRVSKEVPNQEYLTLNKEKEKIQSRLNAIDKEWESFWDIFDKIQSEEERDKMRAQADKIQTEQEYLEYQLKNIEDKLDDLEPSFTYIIDEAYTKDQIRNKFYKHTFNSYKKSNGEDYATDMANRLTNKFDDEDFEYVANWLNSMTFPLTVYRGYRIYDISKKVYGDGVNLDNPGRHWTTDPQMFFNRGTIGNSKMNYIAVGEVDKNDVDWDSTIDTFMYYSLPGKTQYGAYPENEIYLRKFAKPKNVKVYHRDDFLKKFHDSLNEKLLSAKLKKYDGADGKKKYIHDFMRSDEAIEEFPDAKQRYAVCISYWNNRNKVL